MKYVFVRGVVYGDETKEQADAREKAMESHNAKVDVLQNDWKRQKLEPMECMREWVKFQEQKKTSVNN